MRINSILNRVVTRLSVLLVVTLFLGSCFLLKGTSAEDDIAKLGAEITELSNRLVAETNPEVKAQIKKDIEAVKENLEKATKRLIEEGKNVDFKALLDQVNDQIKKLGN